MVTSSLQLIRVHNYMMYLELHPHTRMSDIRASNKYHLSHCTLTLEGTSQADLRPGQHTQPTSSLDPRAARLRLTSSFTFLDAQAGVPIHTSHPPGQQSSVSIGSPALPLTHTHPHTLLTRPIA